MKKIYILILLLTTSCISLIHNTSNQTVQAEVIRLPNDLNTQIGVTTEKMFDEGYAMYKDTVIKSFKKFNLFFGQELSEMSSIDIRTKVILTDIKGTKKKIFLDKFGRIMCDNKIYKGSIKQAKKLRGKEKKYDPKR